MLDKILNRLNSVLTNQQKCLDYYRSLAELVEKEGDDELKEEARKRLKSHDELNSINDATIERLKGMQDVLEDRVSSRSSTSPTANKKRDWFDKCFDWMY